MLSDSRHYALVFGGYSCPAYIAFLMQSSSQWVTAQICILTLACSTHSPLRPSRSPSAVGMASSLWLISSLGVGASSVL